MTTARIMALSRHLTDLLDDVEVVHELTPEGVGVLEEAVTNFRRGGPELIDEATPHLWAYYRSVASEFPPAERREYGIPELAEGDDIWDEVEFRFPPHFSLGHPPLEPGRSYLSFEGEVSWEPEHGLQLVFEDGERVCKVGPYDGHHTNAHAHAYADASLLGVVFH